MSTGQSAGGTVVLLWAVVGQRSDSGWTMVGQQSGSGRAVVKREAPDH